jgi:tRNA(fMet)-specific endonuclease VapC
MSGERLLDTNIVVAFIGGDLQVRERLEAVSRPLISLVVLGELYYGAAHSARPEKNAAAVDTFAASCTVLSLDVETARLYGSIKAEQRSKGRPIPENDLWIAASSRQYGLVLVTRDRHFGQIERLLTETW